MTSAPGGGYYFEDLSVGMEASLRKVVSEKDILGFAEITGDRNPVHLDAAFAAATPFKERIAHGMLTAGFISAVFGMQLPGPGAIYVSQSLRFKGPVKIGAEVETRVRLRELVAGKRRAVFDCECRVGGQSILDGEAVLMVPGRPR